MKSVAIKETTGDLERWGAALGLLLSPIGLAILSGLLLAAAFPPASQTWLAWVAMVPLISLVDRSGSAALLSLSAWAGGLLFWLISLPWRWEVHPTAWMAWLALATYLSLYWPIFLLLARNLVWYRFPLVPAVMISWLTCDYLQAFLLSGLPWFYPAQSQFRFLALIQISDLLGVWVVSALIVICNASLLILGRLVARSMPPLGEPVTLRKLIWPGVSVLLLCMSLIYGVFRLNEAEFSPGPEVILLQSNLRQALKMGMSPSDIIQVYVKLLEKELSSTTQTVAPGSSVVIWPETSYPWGFVQLDPDISPAQAAASGKQIFPEWPLVDWLNLKTETTRDLNDLSRAVGRPMVVGSVLYDLQNDQGKKANAAIWIDGSSERPRIYRKIHLVPFGEYVPLLRYLPWIKTLAPYEERALPNLVSGRVPVWFDEGPFRYAPVICFEDSVPHLVSRFFREMNDGRPPDVMLNLSNDGWFNGSAEHEMHLATSVFRSVEHRAPMVRAANMGISAIVDGNGAVLQSLPKKTEGVVRGIVPLDKRISLYTSLGDILPQLCLITSFFFIGLTAILAPISRFIRNPRFLRTP